MSPKATPKSASKKETPKKPAAAKADKKAAAKPAEKEEALAPTEDAEAPMIDPDELEEQEEAAESSNQNAAALAAATGTPTEMSASFKNFRHHPDMENFYRFIFENDLRHEALAIIDEIMVEKQQRKLGKGTKAQQAH